MLALQHPGSVIVAVVAAIVLSVVGAIMITVVLTAVRSRASQKWPSTTGRILASELMSHRTLDTTGTRTTIYEPAVSFEYTIGGQHLQGSVLDSGPVAPSSSVVDAQSIIGRYPPGTEVEVFYNPANPSEAVLEHSPDVINYPLLAVLGGVEVILVVMLALALTEHFS